MLAKLSLKAKLIALCGFLASIAGVIGVTAFFTLISVVEKYDHVATINLPNAIDLAKMRGAFKDVRTGVRGIGVAGATEDVINYNTKLITDSFAAYEKIDAHYQTIPFVEGEDELYQAVASAWKDYKEAAEKMRAVSQSTDPAVKAQFLTLLTTVERSAADRYAAAINKLIDFQDAQAKIWVEGAASAAKSGKLTVSVLAVGAFVMAMLLGFLFSAKLVSQLRSVVVQLDSGSKEVASASQQIAEAGSELSASATQQAAALQETVSSIDEVSAMVAKNSDNALSSQKSATSSVDAVDRGKTAISEMISSIEAINRSNADITTQTESSNQEISSIVKVISEIGNKTKVINDIVFQTKLLSFNASVEAARAGEHGKGFAVVAEEVGNLAQMSGNAAKEISQLLEESIRKVEGTVNDARGKIERLMEHSKQRIEGGLTTARRCGEVFDEIVGSVTSVSSMVSEIATASKEQARGVEEINKAMGQMDQVTQQNAAAAQQSASAAEQLTSQAAVLKSMVDVLLSTVEGAGAVRAVAEAPKPQATLSKTSKPATGQVVQLKKKPAPATGEKPLMRKLPLKKAVGAEEFPSVDDPRFEDV